MVVVMWLGLVVVMGMETVGAVVVMSIGYVEGFGCVGSKRTNDTLKKKKN
jgi:hypothetical protein